MAEARRRRRVCRVVVVRCISRTNESRRPSAMSDFHRVRRARVRHGPRRRRPNRRLRLGGFKVFVPGANPFHALRHRYLQLCQLPARIPDHIVLGTCTLPIIEPRQDEHRVAPSIRAPRSCSRFSNQTSFDLLSARTGVFAQNRTTAIRHHLEVDNLCARSLESGDQLGEIASKADVVLKTHPSSQHSNTPARYRLYHPGQSIRRIQHTEHVRQAQRRSPPPTIDENFRPSTPVENRFLDNGRSDSLHERRTLFASNGSTCLYSVPTRLRCSRTGVLMAPGTMQTKSNVARRATPLKADRGRGNLEGRRVDGARRSSVTKIATRPGRGARSRSADSRAPPRRASCCASDPGPRDGRRRARRGRRRGDADVAHDVCLATLDRRAGQRRSTARETTVFAAADRRR